MPIEQELSIEQKATFFDILSGSLETGFSIIDEDLKYLFISEKVYEFLNLDKGDLRVGDSLRACHAKLLEKKTFKDSLTLDDLSAHEHHLRETTTVHPIKTILELTNGHTHELTRKKHTSGITIGMTHDITERIEKDRLFQQALALGRAGHWVYDLKTKQHQLSDSMYEYFSPEAIELINKNGILAAVHPDHKVQFHAAIKNASNTNDKFEVTCRSIFSGEIEQWNRTTGKIIRDDKGLPIKIRAFVQDISQEQNQAKRLKRATNEAIAASKAKSEFLANMSHEIRTPMNGVLGMAELLERSDIDDRQRDYVKVITRSSEALLTIINDILDFSKIEAGAFELDPTGFSLREVIDNVMSLLAVHANEKNLELIVNYPTHMPSGFTGDAGRISQVITNLVGNAIKFTQTGHIVVNVNVNVQDDEQAQLNISVVDTGIGIEQDKLDTVFSQFTQADGSTTRVYGGTGLGLSISRRIIELMNGNLNVESELGRGSKFYFDFALPIDSSIRDNISRNIDFTGIRALIVDDIEVNRHILLERLSNWGMQAYSVDNGLDAFVELKKASAQGTPYDLVLLDYLMPGMNGIEFAKMVTQNSEMAQTQIVMLSSCSNEMSSSELKDLNIQSYIMKPAREQLLFDTLSKVLASQNTTPQTLRTSGVYAQQDSAAMQTTPLAIPVRAPTQQKLSSTPAPSPTALKREPVSIQQHAITSLQEIKNVLKTVPHSNIQPNANAPYEAVGLQAAPPEAVKQVSYHVLVAEDFPLNQEVVALMLGESRYEPDFANNGKIAVEKFKENPEKYCAVLMDISMPVMDGYEASELIRSMQKLTGEESTPIIALTGHALKHDREKCFDANMDDYLTKPVKQSDLIDTLDKWTLNNAANSKTASA